MIVTLADGEAWSTVVGAEGIRVQVAEGEVWNTREGDPEDHVVADAFESRRPGRLALLALGPARVELAPLGRSARTLRGGQPIPASPR